MVIFKLEAHHGTSSRCAKHQRLGRTFTIPTYGAAGLGIHASGYTQPSNFELSAVEPDEEY